MSLNDDWTLWLLVCGAFELQTSALDYMTCGEAGSVGGYCCSSSQYIKSTIEECCFKNKSEKKSIFPLLCLTGELRKRDGDTERRHRGERQDTLILRGLVLTSLWEALFSLPWKESMWLILQAVASPFTFTGYMRIHHQKCICCFAKCLKKQRYLSPPEMSSTVISPISVPNKATTDFVPYHKANKM